MTVHSPPRELKIRKPKRPQKTKKSKAPSVKLPKLSDELKRQIADDADPVGFLSRIVEGRRIRVGACASPDEIRYAYPSLDDRIAVAKILLAKLVPDVKSVEITGDPERPIVTVSASADMTSMNIARRLLYAISGVEDPVNGAKVIDGSAETVDTAAPIAPPEPEPAAPASPDELPEMLQAGEQVVTGEWLVRARDGTRPGMGVIHEIFTTSGALIRSVPDLTSGLELAALKDPGHDPDQMLEVVPVPPRPIPAGDPQPYHDDPGHYRRPAVIR